MTLIQSVGRGVFFCVVFNNKRTDFLFLFFILMKKKKKIVVGNLRPVAIPPPHVWFFSFFSSLLMAIIHSIWWPFWNLVLVLFFLNLSPHYHPSKKRLKLLINYAFVCSIFFWPRLSFSRLPPQKSFCASKLLPSHPQCFVTETAMVGRGEAHLHQFLPEI